ncbi:MAG: T9SS type A sorting domain-containing protein [Bacteroidetes bacterium]|nr:T9SS type A sorting domain-containing protein [Bacteroidota bacterium]
MRANCQFKFLTKIVILILCGCIYSIELSAQFKNNVWCFGDSALIDFTSGVPVSGVSSLDTRGSCISISDTNGDLLFYGNTRAGIGNPSGLLWNKVNQLMLNGDSIAGSGWYHELVIVPNPADDSLYYLFSIGVTYSIGLLYSIIDMKGDNGLGAVIQKNIPLLGSIRMVDCLTAIKHGNGRDWWVIGRESTFHLGTSNNSWYVYLISPSGISNIAIQNIGSLNGTNSGRLSFSSASNKLCFVSLPGLLELYDFDRCSGIISNPLNIEPVPPGAPYPYYWSSEFSQSGRYLYVTSSTVIGKLWQYDTWATNIAATKTLIWQMTFPPATIGSVKRGPDNKIYLSCAWNDSTNSNNYPYPPTAYYTENMNLSVINSPDSAGAACDFQPWSFYLGGKRTYWGLPNNPDYDLPALVGSPCDTLVSQNELAGAEGSLQVYYHPAWEKAFINASHLKGKIGNLLVYDLQGKVIHSEPLRIQNGYYTRDLSMIGRADGMYMVVVETEQGRLVKKVIIE